MPTINAVPSKVTAVLRGGSSTPSRIRTLTAIVLLAIVGMLAVGSVAVTNARDGLRVIGHGAGPQVLATADLYYALSDMNARVATILLIDGGSDLGVGREETMERFEQRSSQANRAVLQAADLAGGDADQRETIQQVLDGMAQYDRLASQAMLLLARAEIGDEQTEQALEIYQQANELMKSELLPAARQVTQDSDMSVQAAFDQRLEQVATLPLWIGLSGLAVIVLLLGLQVYLAVRFRRISSPALVLATVATFVLVLMSLLAISTADENLRIAKEEGHDRILEVAGSRADNNTLQADEAVYRLDMRQNIESAQQRSAIERRMGPLLDGFADHDRTMVALIEDHQEAFDQAIGDGDESLAGWHLIFPGTAGGIALLALLGARLRTAEYH